MANADILSIADTWSEWFRPVPASVRSLVDLPKNLSDSVCLVVQGVRGCGKSTLLRQLISHYQLDPSHCAYLDFEDPRLSGGMSHTTLDRVVEQFRARHPNARRLFFFLDEIQGVEGWQDWLLRQLDRPRGHVFVVTGSNANLLSDELSSALTGRHFVVELFPFDLGEARRRDSMTTLTDYLDAGGFPEPLITPDADRLGRQLFHDIIERDVRERLRARSSLPILQVAQMAFESAGTELSVRSIAAATGVAVDTAIDYLDACEAAYLLFHCPYFAFSERLRTSRPRKYYPVDPGLRRVVATPTSADRGKALECAVHLALRRRYGRVSYWRDRGEVDFVVQPQGRIVPIQVTWTEPEERHHRSLDAFYDRFSQADKAVFITADRFEEALTEIDR